MSYEKIMTKTVTTCLLNPRATWQLSWGRIATSRRPWRRCVQRDDVLINDVVASRHLGPCYWHVRWYFLGWWKHALIGWYEVSCSLLLISLLAWVLKRLNGRLPSTLLMTSWFVHPLPVSKCFYCKSFLWHLSYFLFIPLLKWWFGCSQVHTKSWAGTTYIHSSCKMLMDTYPREYNKFETRVFVVHTFYDFSLC
jgi:hypothetical protein